MTPIADIAAAFGSAVAKGYVSRGPDGTVYWISNRGATTSTIGRRAPCSAVQKEWLSIPGTVDELEVSWANELYLSALTSSQATTGLYRIDLSTATATPQLISMSFPSSLTATDSGSVYFLRGTAISGITGTQQTSPVQINGFDLGSVRAIDVSGPGDYLVTGAINGTPKIKKNGFAAVTIPHEIADLRADTAGGYYAIWMSGTGLNATYTLVHAAQWTSPWTVLGTVSSVAKLTAAYGLDGDASSVTLFSGAVNGALTTKVVALPVPVALAQ